MFNLIIGLPLVVSQHDADDIKSTSGTPITRQSPDVAPRDRQDVQPFVGINCHLRRHEARLRVGLDFDEAKYAMVPSDQVDLASVVRRAEVLRDNTIALVPKIEVGFHLAAASGHEMFGRRLAEMAGRISKERATSRVNQSITFRQ